MNYRYILHNRRHLKDIGIQATEGFLSYLAIKEKVADSMQNQVLCSSLDPYFYFLYREILKKLKMVPLIHYETRS